MRLRIFFHDKCFDGLSSAAVFSRFHRERICGDAEHQFSGLVHRAGALFEESKFDGDENAIVDFKYSASPRITWWFDHHESAFLTAADSDHFQRELQLQQANSARGVKPRKFYDPGFRSCTEFIASTAERVYGFDRSPLGELIRWADIIDGALYPDAKTAVEMQEPAMKLTMVVEATQDAGFAGRLIPLLASRPLSEIIREPFIAELVPPLLERHTASLELLRRRAECRARTVFFDITDQPMEGYNKFIPYYLHPGCIYSVGLSKSSFRVKVSVGSNPWVREHDMVNLARICERYGGGGHARVGAISFDVSQAEAARAAATEIVAELRDDQRQKRC
ncbi:MAG: phosphoesterase [Acidobacteria bacterium]|nr:phosphoesterase [Acidobacteriota bacterium]